MKKTILFLVRWRDRNLRNLGAEYTMDCTKESAINKIKQGKGPEAVYFSAKIINL
jgi:hypothetical protein